MPRARPRTYGPDLVGEDGLEADGLSRDVLQRVLRGLRFVRAQDARREHDRQRVGAHPEETQLLIDPIRGM